MMNMITKYKTFEGIKWYSKGKFEEEEFDDEPVKPINDDVIRLGDHVMVSGTYNNTKFNNNGEVVRLFSTHPTDSKPPYYLQEDHGRNIDIVIKIPGRRDGSRSQYSQHSDCFKFPNTTREKLRGGSWNGYYKVKSDNLKIKKI